MHQEVGIGTLLATRGRSDVAATSAQTTARPREVAETRSLALLFLGGSGLAALLYFALAYIVNPNRDFTAGPELFPAVRSDYRAQKIALFEGFRKQGPVDVLLLSSSRGMLLNGRRIRAATGLRAFNFGLASAKAEDFLAVLRFTRGNRFRHVVIGLDVESLRDSRAPGDSTHPLRQLAVGEASPLDRIRTILPRVTASSYARDIVLSMYLKLRPRPPVVSFEDNGTLQYRVPPRRFEEGFDGCMAATRRKVEDFPALSATQIGYFRQAIEEAKQSGAEVTVWLTGPHPRTASYLAASSNYAPLLADTRQLLRSFAGVRTFDLHDAAGADNHWQDCNHVDDAGAREIEARLMQGWGKATGGF